MKSLKKAIICLVVLSLTVTVFCISGSAAVTKENYRNILDYYEKETFALRDYSDADVNSEYTEGIFNGAQSSDSQSLAIVDFDGDKYLSLNMGKLGQSGSYGNLFAGFNVVPYCENVIFEAEITPAKNTADKNARYPIVKLYASGEALPPVDYSSVIHTATYGYPLLSVNFKSYSDKAAVGYYDGAQYREVYLEGMLDFTEGAAYKVVLFVSEGSYGFRVYQVGNEENAVSLDGIASPVTTVGSFKIGMVGNDMAYSGIVGLDDVMIYEATERRDPSEVNSAVAEWFFGACDIIDECDYETRRDIVEVANRLIYDYGFTSDDERVNESILGIASTENTLDLYEENCTAFIELYRDVDLASMDYEQQLEIKNEAERLISLGVDETYPDYMEFYEIYLGSEETMGVTLCKRFIQTVIDAENALYLVARISFLDSALSDLAVIEEMGYDYPGIEDAKTRSLALNKVLAEMRRDTEKYVAAVKAINKAAADAIDSTINGEKPLDDEFKLAVKAAIDGASVDSTFVNAVNAALLLQKTGNHSGMPGVSAANVVLSAATVRISKDGNVGEKYNTLYSALLAADSSDRYYTVLSQLAAMSDSVGNEDTYLTKCRVEDAVAAYNAEIGAINAAFGTVNRNAAKVNAATQKGEEIASSVSLAASVILVLFTVDTTN